MSTPSDNVQSPPEPATSFCRALYDYVSPDTSMLAIRRGDIIEVVTRLDSGWWDGVVRGVRGWFPSTYTEPISERDALTSFTRLREDQRVTDAMSIPELPVAATANDYWMPQVTADCELYYLNTRTGERSEHPPDHDGPGRL